DGFPSPPLGLPISALRSTHLHPAGYAEQALGMRRARAALATTWVVTFPNLLQKFERTYANQRIWRLLPLRGWHPFVRRTSFLPPPSQGRTGGTQWLRQEHVAETHRGRAQSRAR